MKELVFAFAFIANCGGWNDHDGFFIETLFILLYALNYFLSHQKGFFEGLITDKLFGVLTGLGLIQGFVFKLLLPAVVAFIYYYLEKGAFDGGSVYLLIVWIVWGLFTLKNLDLGDSKK